MMSPPSKRRLAFIACGGGGVIDALCSVQHNGAWPFDIAGVITDRPCGAQTVARKHNLTLAHLFDPVESSFSRRAADLISKWQADCVILLFLRRVGPHVWRHPSAMVWNLHPSLLPAYSGIGALRRNFEDARRAAQIGKTIPMGVTLHIATGDVDAGPIIGQRQFTFQDGATFDRASHLAFLCKVGLVLEALCHVREANQPPHEFVNEAIVEAQQSLAQPWALPWLRQSHRSANVELAERVVNS